MEIDLSRLSSHSRGVSPLKRRVTPPPQCSPPMCERAPLSLSLLCLSAALSSVCRRARAPLLLSALFSASSRRALSLSLSTGDSRRASRCSALPRPSLPPRARPERGAGEPRRAPHRRARRLAVAARDRRRRHRPLRARRRRRRDERRVRRRGRAAQAARHRVLRDEGTKVVRGSRCDDSSSGSLMCTREEGLSWVLMLRFSVKKESRVPRHSSYSFLSEGLSWLLLLVLLLLLLRFSATSCCPAPPRPAPPRPAPPVPDVLPARVQRARDERRDEGRATAARRHRAGAARDDARGLSLGRVHGARRDRRRGARARHGALRLGFISISSGRPLRDPASFGPCRRAGSTYGESTLEGTSRSTCRSG